MDKNSPKLVKCKASDSGEHRLELSTDSESLIANAKKEAGAEANVAEAAESLQHSVDRICKILWLVLGKLSGSTKRQDSAIAWARILTVACLVNTIGLGVLLYRHEKQSRSEHERGAALLAEIKSSHADLQATRKLTEQSKRKVEKIDRAVAERDQSESRVEIKPSKSPGKAYVRILPPVQASALKKKSAPAVEIPIDLQRARTAR